MSKLYCCTLVGLVGLAPASSIAAASWEKEVVSQTSLSLPANGTIRVDLADADVQILGGASTSVEVEVVLAGEDMAAARSAFEKMKFRATATGKEITIRSNRYRKNSWWGMDQFQMTVIVKTPSAVRLKVLTRDGDILTQKIDGDVELKTSDGDVRISDVSGRRVVVSTKDGDISAERVAGDVRMKTSDGDMSLTQISGTKLEARTSDGDISARDITPERIDLKTGDGDVAMRGIAAVPTKVRTSDGDISVVLAGSAAARVKLRGDSVRISGEAVFQGDLERRRVDGTLNQGGPLLEMSTGDGSIRLALEKN